MTEILPKKKKKKKKANTFPNPLKHETLHTGILARIMFWKKSFEMFMFQKKLSSQDKLQHSIKNASSKLE